MGRRDAPPTEEIGGQVLRAAPVIIALLAAALVPATAAARTAKAVEQRLVDCANSEREERGIDPLRVNTALGKAARLHARNMARHDFFDHTDHRGEGPQERVERFTTADWGVGENIHQYYRSVKRICSDWMASAGHRMNILDPDYDAIGGGYARDRGGRRHLYVLVFGIRL
jgi:uncharacterized protein YkwD